MTKTLAELTLLDRFLFDQAVQEPTICKIMLELALSRELGEILTVTNEKTIEPFYGLRGARMVLLAVDDVLQIFDLEMQAEYKSNLKKRTRCYKNLFKH
jgi:hypothetical protein